VSGHAMKLSGPSLESKDGVEFRAVQVPRSRDVVIGAHGAMIFEL
jgi:hypothetical protein